MEHVTLLKVILDVILHAVLTLVTVSVNIILAVFYLEKTFQNIKYKEIEKYVNIENGNLIKNEIVLKKKKKSKNHNKKKQKERAMQIVITSIPEEFPTKPHPDKEILATAPPATVTSPLT